MADPESVGEMQMVDRGPDSLLERIAEANARKGEPGLRVRMQPQVLDKESYKYYALPQVSWIMDVSTPEGVRSLRLALDAFFQLTGLLGGPSEALGYLNECLASVEAHQKGAQG